MNMKFESLSDPNKINREMTDFISVINVFTDMLYIAVIFFYSAQPWHSLACCIAMPLLNVPVVKYSAKVDKPYFYISMFLSGPIIFYINWFAGSAAPGWFFGFNLILGIILLVRVPVLRIAYVAYTFACTLAGMYAVGKGHQEMVIVVTALFVFTLAVERTVAYLSLQNKALEQSRQKVDSLLANILPLKIANRMKAGETKIADAYQEVSIMFIDIVGFTKLSSVSSADDVVLLLDEIFSRFDELADRYGLEKIKTIGDAYMVAGGIPDLRQNPSLGVAYMAIECHKVIEEISKKANASLLCRAGIHQGPIVAGVIGHRKFAYDLWGDTVNTASRMESHSEPGYTQCTDAVYKSLKDSFVFEKRGIIEVKGKGNMEAYFLLKANGSMPEMLA